MTKTERFIRYGVATDLSTKAVRAGLTVSSAKAQSRDVIGNKFGLSNDEVDIIKNAITRKPIDMDVLYTLLQRSNFVCNLCKGQKGHAYIIHHIEEYELSQDNSYQNLIVLCPNDHDLAHRSGLTLGVSKVQLRKAKHDWEAQVELQNVQRAAQSIDVNDDAIDYINVKRIEERCVRLFGAIPKTTLTDRLKRKRILDEAGSFDQKYVQSELSGGRYLFDYMNSMESDHYKQLMEKIATRTDFDDLSTAAASGHRAVKHLEGAYCYFIGGVCSKRPRLPLTNNTPAIRMHYTTKKICIEWLLDPMFLYSMSSIGRMGSKNRYIIYCLVRTVDLDSNGAQTHVTASPLLIAQPKKYVDKTPAIGYQRLYERYKEDGWIEDEEIINQDEEEVLMDEDEGT